MSDLVDIALCGFRFCMSCRLQNSVIVSFQPLGFPLFLLSFHTLDLYDISSVRLACTILFVTQILLLYSVVSWMFFSDMFWYLPDLFATDRAFKWCVRIFSFDGFSSPDFTNLTKLIIHKSLFVYLLSFNPIQCWTLWICVIFALCPFWTHIDYFFALTHSNCPFSSQLTKWYGNFFTVVPQYGQSRSGTVFAAFWYASVPSLHIVQSSRSEQYDFVTFVGLPLFNVSHSGSVWYIFLEFV